MEFGTIHDFRHPLGLSESILFQAGVGKYPLWIRWDSAVLVHSKPRSVIPSLFLNHYLSWGIRLILISSLKKPLTYHISENIKNDNVRANAL